jgi:Flp pilus assembly protein TadD
MPRDREADSATLRRVQAAAQAGLHAEAARLATAALADGLVHPLLLNVAALQFEHEGRLAEAETLLRRAVALAPRDPGSRNALGICLLRLERPALALEQFTALLALDDSLPYAHASRGNSLLALGDVGPAEASFQRALALDPRQGIALAGLAYIASRRGVYAEARTWAERALAVLPGYPDAVMSLAAADLGEREYARAEARIGELLDDPRLAPVERAHALGMLGDIFDADRRPVDAFAAYSACNEELRRIYASRYEPGAALAHVRMMCRYFEGAAAADWQKNAAYERDPGGPIAHVFLIGFPRSGTTLLEVILEGHPDVVSLEEKDSLIESVRRFMRGPKDLDLLARQSPSELAPLRADYWRRVAAAGAEVTGKIFVDKNPLDSLKLPLIARLFPGAKILFACRDPRDIVLSCFRHRFRMSAPIYELLRLDGAARYYDAVMELVVRASNVLKVDTLLVRHEDLVTGFAREMRRICTYLGIEWAPAMGDFALRTVKRPVLTPSTAQLARGLGTEGLGHWHRYRSPLEPILPLLDPWVRRFYYDP